MSIKPLLSNRQLVSVRRFTAPKRPSAAHINVPILNAIPDTRPLTNYTPIPVKLPDGVLSDGSLTVPPTTSQTNPSPRVTSYQEASLDLISWEEMAPKEATPAQGTQGSLVNKPQASASGIPSIYETDLPQDNFWNLEEIQLFDFCALPQPERAQIIKRLDAVKSKLWSLSLPDKDPLGFQGVHTDLPAEASLALSPECLTHKSEDPGLLQTPSADATECLPAMQSINATSTNWRCLEPYSPMNKACLSPFPAFVSQEGDPAIQQRVYLSGSEGLSGKKLHRMTIKSGNPTPRTLKCLSWNIAGWGRRCGTTECTNYIQSFDVVLLQETWACDKISLTGFTVTSLAATKQFTTGRPKRGLACLVSTSLKVETVELPPCGSLAMALLIKRGCSKLLVFNLYLP
ncbi:hypothetical protein E2320_019874 [Naja naja]|nr:hypothetical protein E2320_019874 [Naja naja]